jgi:hypothetical protein
MPNATVRATARTLPEATKSMPAEPASPEAAPQDEYIRALAAKCVADARYEVAAEKRKAEAEAPKLRASREFGEAYYAWITAKARIENPSVEDDEQAGRDLEAEATAERRLLTTPAAYPDQFWSKLEAFEAALSNELVSGPRRESILLLALGGIKQDVLNLDLLEGAR